MHFRARYAVSAACLIAAVSGPLSAQSVAPARNELRTPEQEKRDDPAPQIRREENGGLQAPCPFTDNSVTFTLGEGALEFRDARGGEIAPELRETVEEVDYPTGELALSTICDIRDAVNGALRRDGWIATVQIREQELTGGLVLHIVAASITQIRITGEVGPHRGALDRILAPLNEMTPLNERDAERVLLLANDIPGLSVRLSLAPSGEGAGEVIGNLAAEYEPFGLLANVRNYNARSIGRETGFIRAESYGITGLADRTFIAAQSTLDFSEQFILQGGHEFGLGSSNTRIGVEATYAEARPDIQNLDLEAETFIARGYISYPALRTLALSLDLSLGFEWADQETGIANVVLSKDALRSLYSRADLTGRVRRSAFDLKGAQANGDKLFYTAALEFRQGLDALGATSVSNFGVAQTDGITASRPFGDASTQMIRGALDVQYYAPHIFDARVRVEGQWAADPLLNFEEYALGNLSIGRGYDPGAASGDRAIGISAEVGATYRFPGREHSVRVFGYYDHVQLENLDRGTTNPLRNFASLGGGVSYSFARGLTASVIYASPQDKVLLTDPGPPSDRVLFSLTTQFPSLIR
jgi:hemolysin activation/secretion protein